MKDILMYSTKYCPHCASAKMLLDRLGLEFNTIDVSFDAEKRAEMERVSGRRTVPQIFIDGQHVGGSQELHQYFSNRAF